MRILLIGTGGQVGHELQRTLASLGEVHGVDYPAIDLADPRALRALCRETKPGLIVNAAAYTAVDKAESEPALALAINGTAPGVLAREARQLGAVLVHYSTDYVFDGSKREPWREDDAPAPLNEYGRTKLEGDLAIARSGCKHLIFRTTWVYGPRGGNFLLTMLKLAATREELRIVADQRGAPTSSLFLAEATVRAIRAIPREGVASGIYNLSAGGETTWASFAEAIFARAAARPGFRAPRVIRIASSDYPTPARRPAYSVLDPAKFTAAFGFAPPSWESQLDAVFAALPSA
ncbi:MAG: dTDP-4-dehydrorhamnose reductase [Betaproteobacteria bacterium]|nr:dTDP-4-dehydrorhamnose reductase [Betaproteobacteria bacterium]